MPQTPAQPNFDTLIPQQRQQVCHAAKLRNWIPQIGTAAPQQEQATLNNSAAFNDANGQQLLQNVVNYKAAQTRKVSPQSSYYQLADRDKTETVAANESQNNLSKAIPAEAEFGQLIGNGTDGMLARFLQNKLRLMFWHRLSTEPDLIFGAQLNLDRVVDGLRDLVQAGPELQR